MIPALLNKMMFPSAAAMGGAAFDPLTAENVTLSNSDLTATNTVNSTAQGAQATIGETSGKYYFEVTCTTLPNIGLEFKTYEYGVGDTAFTYDQFADKTTGGAGGDQTGLFYSNGGGTLAGLNLSSSNGLNTGDIIGVAVDLANRKMWGILVGGPDYPNPLFWNGATSSPSPDPAANVQGFTIPTGTMTPRFVFNDNESTQQVTFNFGASAFTMPTVPYGFASGWGTPSAGSSADANFSSVVLLCGFEFSVTDESTTTNKGQATNVFGGSIGPSTSTKAIGLASEIMNTNVAWSWADSNDWDFTGNFTIEFRFRTTSVAAGTKQILGQWVAAGNQQAWRLVRTAATIIWQVSTTGANTFSDLTSGTISVNTFYAIAVDFDGTTYRLYIDGVVAATSVTLRTIFASSGVLSIGSIVVGNSHDGFIDELRITKGVARYAGAYTIASSPFPRFSYAIASPTTFDATSADGVTLSNGNLTLSNNVRALTPEQGVKVATSSGKTSDKYYFEITCVTQMDADATFGICLPAATYNALYIDGTGGVTAYDTGRVYSEGNELGAYFNGFTDGDTMAIAIDLDNRSIWFKNVAGSDAPSDWNNDPGNNPATNTGGGTIPAGTMVPFCTFGGTEGDLAGNVFTANFGATAFSGTVPSGFTSGWPV